MPHLRAYSRSLLAAALLTGVACLLFFSTDEPASAATCAGLTQQAENGERSGHFILFDGSRDYVGVPNGSPAANTSDFVEFCVVVRSAGVYRLDAEVRAKSTNDNSFLVQLNRRDPFVFDTGIHTSWTTVPVTSRDVVGPISFGLSQGNHRLRFYQREDGTFLDAFSFVRTGGTPTRLSGSAPAPTAVPRPTATPRPTPAPTVAPAPGPVNGFELAPPPSVKVWPSSDLRALVREYPAGTTFLIQAGVHRNVFRVEPRNDQRIIGQDGAIIDGGGADETAFRGLGRRVEIRKLEIRNYAPGLNAAPIAGRQGQSGDFNRDWVIADNYIHSNDAAGINVGSGMRIVRNRITRNSQIGISGLGTVDNPLVGVEILDNTITGNATDTYFDFNHHEGGIKLTTAHDVVITGNAVHNNRGVGIYCDVYCEDVVIEDNSLTGNGGRANGGGIYFEVSSGGRIRNNTVDGMGTFTSAQHGGVTIGESQDVLVEGNTIRMANGVGIMVRNLIHLSNPPQGRRALTGVTIRNNRVVSTGGVTRVGLIGGAQPAAGAVRYLDNDYRNGTGRIEFGWSGDGGPHTWAEWLDRGYDATGSFV